MADVLSISASIAGLVGLGAQVATTVVQVASSVSGAEKQATSIATNINITIEMLTQLSTQLNNEDVSSSLKEASVATLHKAIKECEDSYNDLDQRLRNLVGGKKKKKSSTTSRQTFSVYAKVKWAMMEPRLELLRTHSERLKSVLDTLLGVTTLIMLCRRNGDEAERKEQRARIEALMEAQKEASEALKLKTKEIERLEKELAADQSDRSTSKGRYSTGEIIEAINDRYPLGEEPIHLRSEARKGRHQNEPNPSHQTRNSSPTFMMNCRSVLSGEYSYRLGLHILHFDISESLRHLETLKETLESSIRELSKLSGLESNYTAKDTIRSDVRNAYAQTRNHLDRHLVAPPFETDEYTPSTPRQRERDIHLLRSIRKGLPPPLESSVDYVSDEYRSESEESGIFEFCWGPPPEMAGPREPVVGGILRKYRDGSDGEDADAVGEGGSSEEGSDLADEEENGEHKGEDVVEDLLRRWTTLYDDPKEETRELEKGDEHVPALDHENGD